MLRGCSKDNARVVKALISPPAAGEWSRWRRKTGQTTEGILRAGRRLMSCGTGEETVKVEHVMYALCQTSGERTRASSAQISICF